MNKLKFIIYLSLSLSTFKCQKSDWEFCSKDSECLDKCCSKQYSDDGQYKCTPGGTQCGGQPLKPDWDFCQKDDECADGCCSKQYSDDGKYKCTPGGTQCGGNINTSGFVQWDGKNFILNNNKFVPVGPNVYWLGIMEDFSYPTKLQAEEMFIVAQKMSSTVIRSHTLGFSSGNPQTLNPNCASQNLNEQAWDSIDYAFSLARQYGIKIIAPLTDAYIWYQGNYGDYTNARNKQKDQFWTDSQVRQDFKNYISQYLNHVNKYTGVAIKDSPELFMIELGNELGNIRPNAGSTSIPTYDWLVDISSFIKTIDQNHLILNPGDESLGQSNEFSINSLDCYSAHFYGQDYSRLDYGANKAASVNKPYIIGEQNSHFGDDWFKQVESRPNVKGSLFWDLYPHQNGINGGQMIQHDDGFTLHYPEDLQQLNIITGHFRRMQGLQMKELV